MVSMMKTRRLVPLADCLMRSHVCTEGHGQATWDIILQPGPDLGQCAGAPAPSAHGLAGLRCRACRARAAGKSLALFSPGKPRGRLDLTVLSLSLDYFPWGISPQSQTMVPDLPPEDLPIHRWSSPPPPPHPKETPAPGPRGHRNPSSHRPLSGEPARPLPWSVHHTRSCLHLASLSPSGASHQSPPPPAPGASHSLLVGAGLRPPKDTQGLVPGT